MPKPASVQEVLEQLGITVHGGERELACSCPFHTDAHPSFSVNAVTGLWICYSCGRGGSLSMLIKEMGEGANSIGSVDEVLRDIRHKAIPIKTVENPPKSGEEEPPPPDPLFIYARYCSYTDPPNWALVSRLINAEMAEEYGLRWDRGWVLPIWAPRIDDEQTSLWGYQWKRMSVVSNWPKQVKKSHTLFGLRELTDKSFVALVESPLDVVRMASVGVPAVAAFGAYVSKYQQQLLVECADHIVLALDNDEAGKQQSDKIYPYLARHVPTTRAVFPRGCKDPGDMTDDQLVRTFGDVQRNAVPLPARRRRHDADPKVIAAGSRSRARKDRNVDRRLRGADRQR